MDHIRVHFPLTRSCKLIISPRGERIHFSVTIRTADRSDSPVPLTLSSYRALLHCHTILRVPGSSLISKGKDHSVIITSENHFSSYSGPSRGFLNTALPIDVPVIFGDITLNPAQFPPTFRSFAVIRTYSLVLKVKILCLEKYFEVGRAVFRKPREGPE